MLTDNVLMRILNWILRTVYSLLVSPARQFVNITFQDRDPFHVSVSTATAICALYLCSKIYPKIQKHGIVGAIQLLFLSTLKRMPGGKSLIDGELSNIRKDLEKELKPPMSKHKVYHQLPEQGVSRKLIREEMLFQLSQEKTVRSKRGHGGMYVTVHQKYNSFASESDTKREEMTKLIDSNFSIKEEAYLYFSHTNTLYPDLFPGIHKFDLEIISMVSSLLHAPEPAGVLTSGGSESIFMAVKCWRSYMEKERGIDTPNIVLCDTAHPAFVKSCHYLRIEARFVPMIKTNDLFGTMDIHKMESVIDNNTICIVASAPCYSYSVVDDIEAICEVAKRKGDIPVHVDHCFGGFCLSFLYDLKLIDTAFDFRIDGVSSMSCDVHKQAGADKGCSAVIYRSFALRRHQFYAFPNWPGGLYASSGLQGSSNGGLKAVAWAMLVHKGREYLQEKAMNLFTKVEKLKNLIEEQVEDCKVLGNPVACGVAFKFTGKMADYDYAVAEALHEIGGWHVSRMQFPTCLAFIASQQWIDEIDHLVADLSKATKLVQSDPNKYNKSGMAGIYGTAASFPDRGMISEAVLTYMDVIMTPSKQEETDN